ncbi:hypothetical protein KCP69_04560 [Salmonella enterica subsp. enterica]|nr:hypothetical protein KCP69_04560 [Salmonella enterica subsp. enterica]
MLRVSRSTSRYRRYSPAGDAITSIISRSQARQRFVGAGAVSRGWLARRHDSVKAGWAGYARPFGL